MQPPPTSSLKFQAGRLIFGLQPINPNQHIWLGHHNKLTQLSFISDFSFTSSGVLNSNSRFVGQRVTINMLRSFLFTSNVTDTNVGMNCMTFYCLELLFIWSCLFVCPSVCPKFLSQILSQILNEALQLLLDSGLLLS